MRVAALYDIHGNLPALEAVLEEVREADVDVLVIGGDVVPGPMPGEAIDLLLEQEITTRFIRGNGDREVLAIAMGIETGNVPEPFREVVQWTARQLTPEHVRVLAGWPATVRLPVDGLGDVLFCHATPGSDTQIFTRVTAEHRLLPIFEACEASLVVCGHTHMQFDRTIGQLRVVNAGSVGMPFGEPGADWLLVERDIRLRHTDFDLAEAAARIRATEYPQAEDFAARNILQPPSEAEMLEAFGRAELR